MFVCLSVCDCVFDFICVSVFVYVCDYVCETVYVWVSMFVCVVCVCECVSACMFECV